MPITRLTPTEVPIGVIRPRSKLRVVFGKSPRFDFEAGDFVIDPKDLTLVEGLENLKQWIRKALGTPRYAHPIYTWQFGNEIFDLIGTSLMTSSAKALVNQFVREALLIDPRIKEISNVETSIEEGNLYVSFTVTTVEDSLMSLTVDLVG